MGVTEPSGGESAVQAPVRVFLSYAWEPDSGRHQAVVREFWGFLRSQGIDAHLDLGAANDRQDWALWMADQIREADHILVIASSGYRARAQGQSGPGTGRGVQWEARLIRDAFYRDQDALNRFVPVVLAGQNDDGIPDFLAPATTTVYHVREFTLDGAEPLLRLLTRQPHEIPPLGSQPVLPSDPPAHPDSSPPATINGAQPPPWTVPVLGKLTHRHVAHDSLLRSLLDGADTAVGVVASVEGSGGVGKTSLAALVCGDPRLRERYPGGLVWVTIGQDCTEDRLGLLVSRATETLVGSSQRESDVHIGGARLGKALDSQGPCLLVLDDVWTTDQLTPFLIGGSGSRRLITTRIRGIVPQGAPVVLLDHMDRDEAIATLTQGVDGMDDDLAESLIQITGRWPLLLGIINGILSEAVRAGNEPNTVSRWVLERLAKSGPAALDLRNASSRARAVSATMRASLDLLPDDVRTKYLQLSIFPEDEPISQGLLFKLWGDLPTSNGETVTDRALSHLGRLHLIQERWSPAGLSVLLHDVVRSYLRMLAGESKIAQMNRAFLNSVADIEGVNSPSPPIDWWDIAREETYLWEHLSWHMREARLQNELVAVVSDARWVVGKTEALGAVSSALADLEASFGEESHQLAAQLRENQHVLAPHGPPGSVAAAFVLRLGHDPSAQPFLEPLKRALPAITLTSDLALPDSPTSVAPLTPGRHRGRVWACAFGPSGDTLVTAADDRAARVWNLNTGEVKLLAPHQDAVWSCAISPDGRLVLTASGDGLARLWSAETGELVAILAGHTASVNCCAFSPDGALVTTVSSDRTARIWGVELATELRRLGGHGGSIRACAFSQDGSMLATGGDDCIVRIWDVHTGELRVRLSGHDASVRACGFLAPGNRVITASSDRTVKLWNLHTESTEQSLRGHFGGLNGLSTAPDGSLIATASSDRTARLWTLDSDEALTVLSGHLGRVNGCAVSPNGDKVATSSGDRTCRIWTSPRWDCEMVLPGESHGSNACHGTTGSTEFITADGDGVARIRSTTHGVPKLALAGHEGWVLGCAMSDSGTRLATVGADGFLRIWLKATGEQVREFPAHSGWARSCRFLPGKDDRILTTGDDGAARLWGLDNDNLLREYNAHTDWVLGCAVSPQENWFATAGADEKVVVWNLDSAVPAHVLEGHDGWVRGCSITANGDLLATSSGDGTIRIWNPSMGVFVRSLTGHRDWVNGCGLSDDGNLVASASQDRTLRIWRVDDGACIAVFLAGSRLSDCTWLPGNHIAAVGDAGVYVLRLQTHKPPDSDSAPIQKDLPDPVV